MYRIGFFSMFPAGSQNPNWAAFVEGLRNHGYVEGKNLQIERRSSEGQVARLPGIAAELVALGLSVVVTTATGPTRAMKEATVTVPIVFQHQHPPDEVEVATGNPSNQPRPFHCRQCRGANKSDKVAQCWTKMTVAAAVAQGRDACTKCFGVRES